MLNILSVLIYLNPYSGSLDYKEAEGKKEIRFKVSGGIDKLLY
jgi:hypothetical protein